MAILYQIFGALQGIVALLLWQRAFRPQKIYNEGHEHLWSKWKPNFSGSSFQRRKCQICGFEQETICS